MTWWSKLRRALRAREKTAAGVAPAVGFHEPTYPDVVMDNAGVPDGGYVPDPDDFPMGRAMRAGVDVGEGPPALRIGTDTEYRWPKPIVTDRVPIDQALIGDFKGRMVDGEPVLFDGPPLEDATRAGSYSVDIPHDWKRDPRFVGKFLKERRSHEEHWHVAVDPSRDGLGPFEPEDISPEYAAWSRQLRRQMLGVLRRAAAERHDRPKTWVLPTALSRALDPNGVGVVRLWGVDVQDEPNISRWLLRNAAGVHIASGDWTPPPAKSGEPLRGPKPVASWGVKYEFRGDAGPFVVGSVPLDADGQVVDDEGAAGTEDDPERAEWLRMRGWTEWRWLGGGDWVPGVPPHAAAVTRHVEVRGDLSYQVGAADTEDDLEHFEQEGVTILPDETLQVTVTRPEPFLSAEEIERRIAARRGTTPWFVGR